MGNENDPLLHPDRSFSSSSKKRASSDTRSSQLTKKRVPLGEVTNSFTESTQLSDFVSTQKQSHHLKKRVQQEIETRSPTELKGFRESGHYNKKSKIESPSVTESTQNSDISINKVTTNNQLDLESSLSSGCSQDLGLKKLSFTSSIYGYLHSLEMEDKRRCLSNYMTEVQTDISVKMREILVDWLVEVADEYKLVSDTLYLTVSYIDRYLSSQAMSRNKLQLLGVSCMLIASKYEEISPPNVEDFCYITDNTYSKEEVVNMEKDVLQFLNYEMSTPTAKNFLRILTKAAQEYCKSPDLQFEFLSCYLAELSLLDYHCVGFAPSIIAASAIFLARFTILPKTHPWNTSLQRCSGYSPIDLKECVLAIHNLQLKRKGSASREIRDKYAQHKFKCVATFSSPSEIPLHYFEEASS